MQQHITFAQDFIFHCVFLFQLELFSVREEILFRKVSLNFSLEAQFPMTQTHPNIIMNTHAHNFLTRLLNSAWKEGLGRVALSMLNYYTSSVENSMRSTILNLLCVSSYFQSNYYILEICIREIILHILWSTVAGSSNWSTFSTYESTNFICFYCFSRCNYLFSVFWLY